MKFANSTMDFIKSLLNLIFPLECKICKKPLEVGNQTYICSECLKKIRLIKEPYCFKGRHYFKSIYSIGLYQGVLREAILLLKYQGVKGLIPPLGKMLLEYCEKKIDFSSFDLILPVPLFRSKEREREFNQAEAFARVISKHYSLPISNGNLLRIRDTRKMSSLNPEERRKNVKNAFIVRKKEEIKDKRILLTDDICTTGATVDECSKVLLTAGAKEITVLTLARTIPKI
jgi:ComF family protein